MKNRFTSIISVAVCILMVISVFTACSKSKKSGSDSTSVSDTSWQVGSEDTYEPVTVEGAELAGIVSEALGDDADGFNGDLDSLTDEQLEKVKTVAEEKGYEVTTDKDGKTVVEKDSSIQTTAVSDDTKKKIYADAGVEESTSLTPDEYKKISKAAEENGVTAVTDSNGDVTFVQTTRVPTTTRLDPKITTGTATTTVRGTTRDSGGTTVTGTSPARETVATQTTAMKLSGGDTYGNGEHCLFIRNETTSDGVVSVGNTYVKGEVSGLIAKFDTSGKCLWSGTLAGDEITKYDDVTVLTDGSIIAVGETLAENLVSDAGYKCKGTVEGVIAKYDTNGNRKWVKLIGGSDADMIYCVDSSPDGGFVIGGQTSSKDGDFKGINENEICSFVAKSDKDGNIIWVNSMGGSLANSVKGITVTPEGTIYAVISSLCKDGDYGSLDGSQNGKKYSVVLKLTADGAINWVKSFWESGNVDLQCIESGNDNGCVVAGSYSAGVGSNTGSFKSLYNGGTKGTYDGIVVKINTKGEIVWKTPLVGFQSDYVTGISAIKGGYAVCGYTTSTNRDFAFTNRGDYDSFAGAISDEGRLMAMTSFGGSDSDRAEDVCTIGTNIYVSGVSLSTDDDFANCSAKSDGKNSVAFCFKVALTQK